MYGGSIVVDNVITTVWIAVTLIVPRMFATLWSRRSRSVRTASVAPITDLAAETESVNPSSIALVLALGAMAWMASTALSQLLARAGIAVPSILVITTLALILAQFRVVNRLAGARALAMFAVYVFLAVIGAFCDLRALPDLGMIGVALFALAATTVVIHGVFVFGTAWLFRMDLDGAAVASQANVGGATSALALAKSLGREDLLVPGILLGALGNAIGTFLAFTVVPMTAW
jgi:uncharacterized membrane protein